MGNVTLAGAKKKVGEKTCSVGSVQIGGMFSCTREEIAERCRQAIRDGGEGGSLILPTTVASYESPIGVGVSELGAIAGNRQGIRTLLVIGNLLLAGSDML